MIRTRAVVATGLLVLSVPATAGAQQRTPRFCPNRPSLESSSCTTEQGHVQLEVSGVDWTLDRDAAQREDTLLFGDLLARVGIGKATEVQFGWSPVGHDRTRDRDTGAVDRATRTGDVRLALRHAFRHPDGKGLSFGIEPFATVPVGRAPIGDGDWGVGVVVPITYDLTDRVNIGFTGEVDAAVDRDGDGRHFAASGVGAVSYDLSDALSATAEMEVLHDADPAGHDAQPLLGTGLLWKYAKTRALYAEAVGGLGHDAPDLRLYAGLAAVF